MGFNAPEWVISDVAAIFAGGFASGIYPTNGPEACKYILEESNCSILVVEDGRQLDKVWALRDQLPHLKKVHNPITTLAFLPKLLSIHSKPITGDSVQWGANPSWCAELG